MRQTTRARVGQEGSGGQRCFLFLRVDGLVARRSNCDVHLKGTGRLRHAPGCDSSCKSPSEWQWFMEPWCLPKNRHHSGFLQHHEKLKNIRPSFQLVPKFLTGILSLLAEGTGHSVSVKRRTCVSSCWIFTSLTLVRNQPDVQHSRNFTPVFCLHSPPHL